MTETKKNYTVRPLEENDLPEADRIMRLAFATFLGSLTRRVSWGMLTTYARVG